jgi:hypothetical protein
MLRVLNGASRELDARVPTLSMCNNIATGFESDQVRGTSHSALEEPRGTSGIA